MIKNLILNRNFFTYFFGTLGILYYKMRIDNKIKELKNLVEILENLNEDYKTDNIALKEKLKEKDEESKRIIEDCEKELLINDENELLNNYEKYEDISSQSEYDKLD